MSLQSHVNMCKKYGFARIPNVFSTQEVNDLRAKALLSMNGVPIVSTDGSFVEVRHGYPTILFSPRLLLDMANDPRLREIVGLYYGHDDFELETQQFYFHLPGDPDEFAWHTDERFRPGVGNLYLQTAILCDDWDDDNSAVEFIAGSHLKPFENGHDLRKFIRRGMSGTKLKGKAGDVLTWSNTVVHGSERNLGKSPRMYYMHGFRAKNKAEC